MLYPDFKIRLLIDVGGSATISMVTSENDFDEVADTVAGVLEKDIDDLNLSYKPSWATKATPNTNLAGKADWEFLLEQIRDYMLRALGKKGNNGVIPSWTISIIDASGEQQKARGKKSGNSEDQVSMGCLATLVLTHSDFRIISRREMSIG
jgi:hypothetical protein